MIVWGGYDAHGEATNTGGRYNPGTDSWTATSIKHAPFGRYSHTAVWTGAEMIVWGGAVEQDTGGKYNSSTDSWTSTTQRNAPTGRGYHTAVWTGSEMIIWGGSSSSSVQDTGGRYNPDADSWTETSTTNAPTGRVSHTAVWTDGEMIVWGGHDANFVGLNTGGRYCAQAGGADLTLVSAASRKTHGAKGDFDIDLPLTGDLGIECRSGLTRYAVVFTFNNNLTGADSANSSCGTVGSISVDPLDAHNLIVTFNGATCDGRTVTVTANNVHDDQGNTLASASASMGLLVGDVTGNGHVGNGDIGNIQAHKGERANSTNFRDDINADGRINNQDVQAARSHRGESHNKDGALQ
jgi:hypothetical protein